MHLLHLPAVVKTEPGCLRIHHRVMKWEQKHSSFDMHYTQRCFGKVKRCLSKKRVECVVLECAKLMKSPLWKMFHQQILHPADIDEYNPAWVFLKFIGNQKLIDTKISHYILCKWRTNLLLLKANQRYIMIP